MKLKFGYVSEVYVPLLHMIILALSLLEPLVFP